MTKTLSQLVQQYPFPQYQHWRPIGADFIAIMAQSIWDSWRNLPGNRGDLGAVQAHLEAYLRIVYQRPPRSDLVALFVSEPETHPWMSGEFDALSYAFYRHAFELLAKSTTANELVLLRRAFTRRVGRSFFAQIQSLLHFDLPDGLNTAGQYKRLRTTIQQIGAFLIEQGYLHEHFAFRFDVNVRRGGQWIHQRSADFLPNLQNGLAYALYEMGNPAILPSAVYLFHLVGEAQHHSSRIVEELFRRMGCRASETDDFDPTGFPPQLVVELWEIRPH